MKKSQYFTNDLTFVFTLTIILWLKSRNYKKLLIISLLLTKSATLKSQINLFA